MSGGETHPGGRDQQESGAAAAGTKTSANWGEWPSVGRLDGGKGGTSLLCHPEKGMKGKTTNVFMRKVTPCAEFGKGEGE